MHPTLPTNDVPDRMLPNGTTAADRKPMADPTKVLLVLLGLGTGGAERSVVDLAPLLRELGVELSIHCRGRRTVGAEADLLDAGVDISFATDPRFVPWVRELRHAVRSTGPHVVHTTLFEADLAGRLAAVGTGVPVLTSIVNESYGPSRRDDPAIRPWKLEATRRIEGFTARTMTAHVHALTKSVARACVSDLHVDPTRITVVPRGRDPGRLGRRTAERRVQARSTLGLSPDAPVLLCVGRQEYQKGHDVLLQAFAQVRTSLPEARLVLTGRDGAATPRVDALVEQHSLHDAVLRTGHLDDVASLFCAADVFVFPSRFEGLGGVLLEAMALELPIVATDIGPVRETVGGDTGAVLVAPEDPTQLADGVRRVLHDPALAARLAQHGRERFEHEYSLDTVAERMAELYATVARAGRRSRTPHLPTLRPTR